MIIEKSPPGICTRAPPHVFPFSSRPNRYGHPCPGNVRHPSPGVMHELLARELELRNVDYGRLLGIEGGIEANE